MESNGQNRNNRDSPSEQDMVSPSDMSPSTATATTITVDGAGLWANFTRTFKAPIMALLDILDNAVDAGFIPHDEKINGNDNDDEDGTGGNNDDTNRKKAASKFMSRIHINKDNYDVRSLNSPGKRSIRNKKTAHISTGIIIRNNSFEKISDINEILTVFKSAKGRASESIGENGVGLKQGCAAIADLNFVLIRNERELSFGVVAKKLQKDGQLPLFPRFVLTSPDVIGASAGHDNEWGRDHIIQVMKQICNDDPSVGECIAEYGFQDLNKGIDRLVSHFETMFTHETWKEDKFIFTLVLDQIRQKKAKQEEDLAEAEDDNEDIDKGETIDHLLGELEAQLPVSYLHIHDSSDIRVCDRKVHFKYWQQRLVELTSTERIISKSVAIFTGMNVNNPPGEKYNLRVFCGFDPIRCHNIGEQSALSLHVYSRKTGRRVLSISDARAELKLTASGTHFAQGLTVIVDDVNGALTLNPRKDDIAFGEEEYPTIHKENLYRWLGCIAKTFWNLHCQKFPRTSMKGDLSSFLKKIARSIEKEGIANPEAMPTLANGDFSTLDENITWYTLKGGNLSSRKGKTIQRRGSDTLVHIPTEKRASKKETKTRKRKTSTLSSEKKKKVKAEESFFDMDDDDDDDDDDYNDDADDMSSVTRVTASGRTISAPALYSLEQTQKAREAKIQMKLAYKNEEKVKNLEVELEAARAEIKGAKSDLENACEDIDTWKEENSKIREKYEKLKSKYNSLKGAYKEERRKKGDDNASNTEIVALKKQNAALEQRLNAVFGIVKQDGSQE